MQPDAITWFLPLKNQTFKTRNKKDIKVFI